MSSFSFSLVLLRDFLRESNYALALLVIALLVLPMLAALLALRVLFDARVIRHRGLSLRSRAAAAIAIGIAGLMQIPTQDEELFFPSVLLAVPLSLVSLTFLVWLLPEILRDAKRTGLH